MSGYVKGLNTDGEPLRDWYVAHSAADYGLDASKDGMCRQEYADECNINVLLAQYERNGGLPPLHGEQNYFDTVGMPDYQEAANMMIKAGEAFMRLPALVRKEFDNDPGQFVEFASDPKNLDKMREWGLAAPAKPEAKPVQVQVMNPPPEEAVAGEVEKPAKPSRK